VEHYRKKLGVSYNKIFIRDQKTRWGSCSSKGNLNFNWRLIMAPLSIMDYIVVHELVHLIHPNHGRDFLKLVESVIPDYKEKKQWLRINGYRLKI
ncbi:MAG: M48 family metallopeptidase, partial [Halanaerobiales bacterium]